MYRVTGYLLIVIPITLVLSVIPVMAVPVVAVLADENCIKTVRDGKIVKICDGVIFDKFGKRIGAEPKQLEFGSASPSIGWKIQSLFQDFTEWIEFDPLKKAELKLRHAQENQIEIESYAQNNQPIPREFEERRLTKLEEADLIVNSVEQNQPELAQENTGLISKLRTAFDLAIHVGEVNELRIAFSEFQELKKIKSDNQVEKLAIANAIDQRVNRLDIVKKYCIQSISSLALSELSNPYIEAQRICPVLANISPVDARQALTD